MNAREYWKVIRRKWPVMLACALAAGLVMWVVTPAEPPVVDRVKGYTATATVIVNSPPVSPDEPSGQGVSFDRMALYITTGEIPRRAAEQVGYAGEPALLASQLSVTPDPASQAITLTMEGSDAAYAASVANAFAEQAIAYFETSPGEVGGASLLILAEATPIPVIASGGFSIPPGRTFRTSMAILLGLLIGFGLALVLHQIDSRLRTREEVYEALRMPVIAEVPKLSRSHREGARILVADEPHGVYADGYRTARAAVMHTASRDVGLPISGATPLHPARAGGAKVVLVTSAQAGEGKTTSIANLSASFAETGRSVLVLDADLRSPDLHLLFDVPQGAGISDYLYDPSSTQLSALARPTSVAGVKIITAGTQLSHPASLATRMGVLVEEARKIADVVLIDTSPILAASDVFDLLPIVDTVLFVVRSGRITQSAGQRVSELLGRFHVPVTGAILIGTPSKRSDGYGYGYGHDSDDSAAQKRARVKGRGTQKGRTRSPRAGLESTAPPMQRAPLEDPTGHESGDGIEGFDPYEGYAPERDGVIAVDEPVAETRRQRRASSR